MNQLILVISSIFITLIFFKSGTDHLKNFANLKTTSLFLSTKFPFNKFNKYFNHLVIIVSSLIEIISPLLILLAIYVPKYSFLGKLAAYLLSFFILTTIVFIHNPVNKSERMNFLKNLSMLGGVILLSQLI
tara:strand:- start:494 stop:886 length:393 start_codon:yes stop_codon:yes gene_type:complete